MEDVSPPLRFRAMHWVLVWNSSSDTAANMRTLKKKLIFLAGERSFERVRDGGLNPDDVKIVAGAAGGPKWLILGQLDRLLFGQWFQGREDPLFLIGSSIGSWRFAATSRRDPVAALDHFESAYIHQAYTTKPSPAEVSRKSQDIMDAFLGDTGPDEVLSHPCQRLNLVAVKSRNLLSYDHGLPLTMGLIGAIGGNLINRNLLRLFFNQTLFGDRRTPPPFRSIAAGANSQVALSRTNFKKVLLASGSIPYVMEGVRDIPGAPPGTYRDGGALDYHLDVPFGLDGKGVVLFPHYTNRIIPGWLDKKLSWRKPSEDNMADVLLVAPRPEFVAELPLGKISDRTDFYHFAGDDEGRFDYWKKVSAAGKELAEEFSEAVDSGSICDRVRPFD